jgi:hypothetical protein
MRISVVINIIIVWYKYHDVILVGKGTPIQREITEPPSIRRLHELSAAITQP